MFLCVTVRQGSTRLSNGLGGGGAHLLKSSAVFVIFLVAVSGAEASQFSDEKVSG